MRVLLLLPLLFLAGCNAGDVAANLPGLSGLLDSALWSLLAPVVTVAIANIVGKLPRLTLVPIDAALGAMIAALAAAAQNIPDMGAPALAGVVLAAAARAILKFLADIKAGVAAAAAGAPMPTVSDAKIYVPKATAQAGAGIAVSAKGQKVTVNGFSPWSK